MKLSVTLARKALRCPQCHPPDAGCLSRCVVETPHAGDTPYVGSSGDDSVIAGSGTSTCTPESPTLTSDSASSSSSQ